MKLQDDWKNKVEKALLDILWSHWIKMGAYVSGEVCQASSDPEVLLLLTMLMAKKDLRLFEVMTQWLHHYESVINVERLKTALKTLPESRYSKELYGVLYKTLQESLPSYAFKRWNKFFLILGKQASPGPHSVKSISKEISRKKLQTHDWILKHNSLLCFRTILGVSAKADIFYFLSVAVGQSGSRADSINTGAHIARALHYDPATVMRALKELKMASLIRVNEAVSDKVYMINPNCPHFSWKPVTDRFFMDWFLLIPVVIGVLSLGDDFFSRHGSIILDGLNERLKVLDALLARVPRSVQKSYSNDNLVEVSIETIGNAYSEALCELSGILKKPRRV